MRQTILALIGLAIAASAAHLRPGYGVQAAQSRTEDEYTRYELLAPDTSTLKISFELAAVTPGARIFFNAIHNATQVSDL